MRFVVLFAALALVGASCSPPEEVTGSTDTCATDLFPAYNSKVLDECIAVCKKCQHGITTTCATSCTLKGAR